MPEPFFENLTISLIVLRYLLIQGTVKVNILELFLLTLLALNFYVNFLELLLDLLLISKQALIVLTVMFKVFKQFIILAVTVLLDQMIHISHGGRAESRRHLLLFIARDVIVHPDFAEPPVYINLPAVLRLLYLHLSLEVLAELHHISLLSHYFVCASSAPKSRLIVFHHVDADKVLSACACRRFSTRFVDRL